MNSPSKTKFGLLILIISLSFCIITNIFQYEASLVNNDLDKNINISSNLTYNQIINSKTKSLPGKLYKDTEFNNSIIEWRAKISAHYTQITGIKFCIIDESHQNVDISEPCDLFWTFSDDLKDADIISVNPDWDGLWVPCILNYYNVQFDKKTNYYNDIYTVKGTVNGLDCALGNQCVPDIDIISIY